MDERYEAYLRRIGEYLARTSNNPIPEPRSALASTTSDAGPYPPPASVPIPSNSFGQEQLNAESIANLSVHNSNLPGQSHAQIPMSYTNRVNEHSADSYTDTHDLYSAQEHNVRTPAQDRSGLNENSTYSSSNDFLQTQGSNPSMPATLLSPFESPLQSRSQRSSRKHAPLLSTSDQNHADGNGNRNPFAPRPEFHYEHSINTTTGKLNSMGNVNAGLTTTNSDQFNERKAYMPNFTNPYLLGQQNPHVPTTNTMYPSEQSHSAMSTAGGMHQPGEQLGPGTTLDNTMYNNTHRSEEQLASAALFNSMYGSQPQNAYASGSGSMHTTDQLGTYLSSANNRGSLNQEAGYKSEEYPSSTLMPNNAYPDQQQNPYASPSDMYPSEQNNAYPSNDANTGRLNQQFGNLAGMNNMAVSEQQDDHTILPSVEGRNLFSTINNMGISEQQDDYTVLPSVEGGNLFTTANDMGVSEQQNSMLLPSQGTDYQFHNTDDMGVFDQHNNSQPFPFGDLGYPFSTTNNMGASEQHNANMSLPSAGVGYPSSTAFTGTHVRQESGNSLELDANAPAFIPGSTGYSSNYYRGPFTAAPQEVVLIFDTRNPAAAVTDDILGTLVVGRGPICVKLHILTGPLLEDIQHVVAWFQLLLGPRVFDMILLQVSIFRHGVMFNGVFKILDLDLRHFQPLVAFLKELLRAVPGGCVMVWEVSRQEDEHLRQVHFDNAPERELFISGPLQGVRSSHYSKHITSDILMDIVTDLLTSVRQGESLVTVPLPNVTGVAQAPFGPGTNIGQAAANPQGNLGAAADGFQKRRNRKRNHIRPQSAAQRARGAAEHVAQETGQSGWTAAPGADNPYSAMPAPEGLNPQQ